MAPNDDPHSSFGAQAQFSIATQGNAKDASAFVPPEVPTSETLSLNPCAYHHNDLTVNPPQAHRA